MTVAFVLGGGEDLIRFAETVSGGLGLVLVLLVGKLLFTSTSFGSGTPGGIFMPILAVGALTGSAFALAAGHAGLPHAYVPTLALCAMAGVLAASVQAPITTPRPLPTASTQAPPPRPQQQAAPVQQPPVQNAPAAQTSQPGQSDPSSRTFIRRFGGPETAWDAGAEDALEPPSDTPDSEQA